MKMTTTMKNLMKDPIKNQKNKRIRKDLIITNLLMIKPMKTNYLKRLIKRIERNKGMIQRTCRERTKDLELR